jgi:hypothetical protein
MKFFQTYLSTAPVLAALYFSFIAGLLIELNPSSQMPCPFPLSNFYAL